MSQSDYGKISLRSPNFQSELARHLADLAPQIISDGKLDVEKLQELLGEDSTRGGYEKFGLSWLGKRQAQRTAQLPTDATLHPQYELSRDWENTHNIFIEGENLKVLKALQTSYHGKIKMIYIDPPYNTGNDFVYNDSFHQNQNNYTVATGQRFKDESKKVDGNEYRKNTNTSGAFHSNWLNMMYPRLVLARQLLTDDGIIFISIDDYEVDNLRSICNEIFGKHNSLNEDPVAFIWPRSGATAGRVRNSHEYILAYAKNRNSLESFKLVDFGNNNATEDRAIKKISKSNPVSEVILKAGMRYEGDSAEFTGTIGGSETMTINGTMRFVDGKLAEDVSVTAGWAMKSQLLQWLSGEETYDSKGQRVLEFFFNKNGLLRYRKERSVYSPSTLLDSKVVGTTKLASSEISRIVGYRNPFDYPKPVNLIQYLMSFCTSGIDIVLDFFAGSGTTAQAVIQQNLKDQQNRRFISVQISEEFDQNSEPYINGDKTIPDLVRHRLRKVAQIIQNNAADQLVQRKQPLDTGFRSFCLGESNFKEWKLDSSVSEAELERLFDTLEDSLKEDSKPYSVLFELLLKAGLPLDVGIHAFMVEGYYEFHLVNDRTLVYAQPDITPSLDIWQKALDYFVGVCNQAPTNIYMLEDSLASEQDRAGADSLKFNLVQLAKKYGISRENVYFA